jgi:hypothetical protein
MLQSILKYKMTKSFGLFDEQLRVPAKTQGKTYDFGECTKSFFAHLTPQLVSKHRIRINIAFSEMNTKTILFQSNSVVSSALSSLTVC